MGDISDDIVARRQRYIARQCESNPDVVDVRFEGKVPSGYGPQNRHGMPAVPVGQRVVGNWPVLDLGDLPDLERSSWELEIGGLVDNPVTLDWDAFMALPQTEDESDFHCVTTWSRLDNRWKGVRFSDLAELVVPKPEATHILCWGADVAPVIGEQYSTNLPLAKALSPDVLLVHTWNDEPLPHEHGGPVRMITPRLYAWKGAKWIVRIDFLPEDQKGFWEKRGYSNTAEPWFNDRYSS
jgi:DMSO/TMAO reductase YedYZ molybdopterin-dependent catalytic subunit